ncbi:radical SAM protein [Persicimonas caeni]|uniref:Radical SAM protein n=1 Tax=Persicimonas caeni TaxID=2292766 RepID=A0A4Y6PVB0_PERCE|nr:radical SAM protein [Persicimonas caeni]QDG52281.1 radical SAM protein [Persicimonas caeni]QED33503.1 radical SAM protein [Persicimonas caeni]
MTSEAAQAEAQVDADWDACSFLTCSVLPVRMACNLHCPFCFSKSSVSALDADRVDWRTMDVDGYYAFAKARGATRLVITGGGEPLLRPDDTVWLVGRGARYFDEIACFTNGTLLTAELAARLRDAGLSYLCWSRHHHDDAKNRALMGDGAPALADFMERAGDLTIRATCVMTQGWVETRDDVFDYIDALRPFGVRQFTFKHTYTAYERSVFRGSGEDLWAGEHQVEFDPFSHGDPLSYEDKGDGEVVHELPWGPKIRRIDDLQVCYYHEPRPTWEKRHKTARSCNLLSDGRVYASLEDRQSLLYRVESS